MLKLLLSAIQNVLLGVMKKKNFAPTTQTNSQNSTWRHGRVGQPGPRNTLLTHVKNSTVTVILRTRHSRTRKPEKTNYWKNRDRVTPLGLYGKTNKIKPNNVNTSKKRDAT